MAEERHAVGADGWRSIDRRRSGGSIDSEQGVDAPHLLVEPSRDDGLRLARSYWDAVRRAAGGLVRRRETEESLELRLLGARPALLTFDAPTVSAGGDGVSCTYRITGGLLARRPRGTLTLTLTTGVDARLTVAVEDFAPRIALVYLLLERRFHASVSRRYFRQLLAEGRR